MSSPAPTCPLCHEYDLGTARERARRACDHCEVTKLLPPLPPSRRPPAPCGRCNQRTFVRAVVLDVEIAMQREIRRDPHPPHIARVGDGSRYLEAFICEGCGFVEWYCPHAKGLPIGREFQTERVTYDAVGDGPYR